MDFCRIALERRLEIIVALHGCNAACIVIK